MQTASIIEVLKLVLTRVFNGLSTLSNQSSGPHEEWFVLYRSSRVYIHKLNETMLKQHRDYSSSVDHSETLSKRKITQTPTNVPDTQQKQSMRVK
ncbi:Hypothetical predicted protein [Paramuricea clavata]|uniref:Uncharacterized protein n=1 Tax=Paramuricea clavata TaxID=317549 RepID=A0A7D9DA88_PARCT|nr:Hypothetical predicted protein [Paramuricea clavata]